MKKIISICFLVSMVAVLSTGSSFAQGRGIVGKKFQKKEANVLFGKIVSSVKLKRAEIKEALANAKDYVLFGVKNGRAYLLNERKISLISKLPYLFRQEEKAYAFSKSVVEDFINSSTEEEVTVELRSSVLTVSDSRSTLEFASECPPMCF